MIFSPLFVASTITILWGLTWFFSARISKDLGAVKGLFLFQLLGIPFFIPLIPFAPVAFPPIHVLYIALLGVFITIGMLAFFYALKIGEVSVVNPIADSYLIFLVLLGVIFFHERLTGTKILAIGTIFAGVLVIGTNFKALFKKSSRKLFAGVAPAFFSTLSTAIGLFLVAVLARQGNWLFNALGIRIVVTTVTFGLLLKRKEEVKGLFKKVPWKWILLAALFDVFGFALYNYAVVFIDVSYIAAFVSAQSLIGVVLAHIFLEGTLGNISIHWPTTHHRRTYSFKFVSIALEKLFHSIRMTYSLEVIEMAYPELTLDEVTKALKRVREKGELPTHVVERNGTLRELHPNERSDKKHYPKRSYVENPRW